MLNCFSPSCIGNQLLTLEHFSSNEINVATELLHCSRLEQLEFLSNMSNISPVTAVTASLSIQPEMFLPNLKSLSMSFQQFCLGNTSRLFESRRPALKCLELYCSHIGIPSLSRWNNWEDIPMLRPNIEQLSIQFSSGLTVGKLREILPRIKSLKVLVLEHGPWNHTDQEEALAIEFTADMWNSPSNIRVGFDFTLRYCLCPYLQQVNHQLED